jgi:TDG/mug DNA glycosylase family protein
VPDVLATGLTVVFCGINPGRVSAAAGAHFANPRNDFWRLLHDAGFTPRQYEPHEQFELLELGIGVTNAAYRTTKGSGDLRRGE